MKRAKDLFLTITRNCGASETYNWYVDRFQEHDNIVSFDVRQKEDNGLLLSCAVHCFEEYTYYSHDCPIGRVHFSFYDGCESLEFNTDNDNCQVGSSYMNDTIDMAIKMLYR